MNPEIKKRWTEALRSGKYKQGRSALNSEGEYCCLGVLCELAAEDGIVDKSIGHDGITLYDDVGDWLPYKVVNWAGLTNINPIVKVPDSYMGDASLSYVNDHGNSFDYIADLIETQL